MKIFRCPTCKIRVYFENLKCLQCGTALVFDQNKLAFGALTQDACTNRELLSCNWRAEPNGQCSSCNLNTVIPPAGSNKINKQWTRTEQAKRRLLWSLLRLGLWPKSKQPTLTFQLASPDAPLPDDMDGLMIGHAQGCITIDVSEATASVRHDRREGLDEDYRTLLGHFRHETAHYLWDAHVRETEQLQTYRNIFGDEREDYQTALANHYDAGPPRDWSARFISSYASSHPWEDWAETCAHVLHILDLVETDLSAEGSDTDVLRLPFEALLHHWFPLVERLTSLSRSLGHDDPYPFVIGPIVRDKLEFAWRILMTEQGSDLVAMEPI